MAPRIRRFLALALILPASLAAEIRSLTILHSNDLPVHLQPLDNHRGVFAYPVSAIGRERANCSDCILNLNACEYHAATPGNHEFDYGWPEEE
jgi:2',3'-cyclic-nucleotide 2'-phosphodiesterase (5'-nucleotidase family)